jgi:hypothetical protein
LKAKKFSLGRHLSTIFWASDFCLIDWSSISF